jgi:DNA-binding transcriptional ArsR family regulator
MDSWKLRSVTGQRTAAVARAVPDLAPRAAEAAALLKALGNDQRLLILCNLQQGPLSVSELNARVPLSQSALSQHLAVLREAGIVRTRRKAQTVHYSLPPGPATRILRILYRAYCAQ